MGQHEQPSEVAQKHGFWATARLLVQQPFAFLAGWLAILIVLGVVAINVQNKYGDAWGALVAAFIAPLIASGLLRARLTRRGKR